jgi:hypothetical protein
MTKNWKKITTEKNIKFFFIKLQFTYPEAFIKNVQVTEEAFSSQKKTSNTFLPSWIRIQIPDPDPLIRLNPDPIRFRIRIPEINCGHIAALWAHSSFVGSNAQFQFVH